MLKSIKAKLKKLKNSENKFLSNHTGLAIRVIGLIAIVACIFSLTSSGVLKPHRTKEFARTSVMIVNMAKNSGGSGVILESHSTESIVLTNRHVCGVIQEGGFVIHEDQPYLVTSYKMANSHDLCEIKVSADLGVNTKVAKNAPEKYSDAFISGHPSLFPHVLTKGNFSGRMTINVMIGVEPCTKDNIKSEDDVMSCIFMGGLPIVKTFDSQLVTGTILPGSSGSAVFDENGEIAGLVFASASRELAYAFIVPQEYVKHFVDEEAASLEWKVPAKKPKAPAPQEQSPEEHTSITVPRKFEMYA